METLDTLDHLESYPENGLNIKLEVAEFEEALEARALQVHDKYVVLSLDPKPVNIWNTVHALQFPVKHGFVLEHRLLCHQAFQLNRHFLVGFHVKTLIKYSKGALAQFGAYLILSCNSHLHVSSVSSENDGFANLKSLFLFDEII